MARLRLDLLGRCEIQWATGAPVEIAIRKAQALLVYLALNSGTRISRDRLAGLLWSDRGDRQAQGSLRQTLTILRKALGPGEPSPLIIERSTVSLDPDAVDVDAVAFGALISKGTIPDLEAAVALYKGNLLEGFTLRDAMFEDWLEGARREFHESAVQALTRLLDHRSESGELDEAVGLAQRLLALDPLREQVHRKLMELYAAKGQRDVALQQFNRCREILEHDLGVPPEAETAALADRIGQDRLAGAGERGSDRHLPSEPVLASAGINSETATPPNPAPKMEPPPERRVTAWRMPVLVTAVATLAGLSALGWFQLRDAPVETASVAEMAYPLPNEPSIAVLPFTNLSDDRSQDLFADGMTDDLITDLSKISGLFVIARNSVFAYKDEPATIRQVAEELGVRYVLEGSVRRAGDDVRINAQLVDATTGGHLWAERYDGSLADVFAVQDAFVGKIVEALALNLSPEEQEQIGRGQTNNVEAREAFQRGWENYLRFSPERNAEAVKELERAIELDPDYGRAYAALAMVYLRGCAWRWNEELGMGSGMAFALATQSLDKAKEHPSTLANVAASQIYLYDRQHDAALTEAARAVALDPNDPEAHIGMAWAMITTGKPQAGLEFVDTAMRLNPSHPNHYVMARGMALFAMDELERAAAVFEEALERDPGATELALPSAAVYARLGRRKDARESLLLWRPVANQRELDIAIISYHLPFKWASGDREVGARFADGLNIAALPLEVTVPDLAETLREGGIGDRALAATTLGQFGPAAAAAVPALTEALDDERYVVRLQTVLALEKIGPAAAAAIPALEAIRDDERLGPKVKQALDRIARK